jgi:hypothetical protein
LIRQPSAPVVYHLLHDDYGFVDLAQITSTTNDLSGTVIMNDYKNKGFSELLAVGANVVTGAPEIVVLKPVDFPR